MSAHATTMGNAYLRIHADEAIMSADAQPDLPENTARLRLMNANLTLVCEVHTGILSCRLSKLHEFCVTIRWSHNGFQNL